jgi:hypothetical protein
MSPAVESGDPHRLTRELIERNGNFLPEAIRTDYFRVMSHLTVLPEHDEMLQILLAMQFLSLIIAVVPSQITDEREKLSQLLAGTLETMQAAHTAGIAYQKQLEQPLIELPAAIAKGIRPEAIAEKINESLRQQFLSSGIPETAQVLGLASKQMNQAASDFHRTARQLTASCDHAAEVAHQAIESVRSALSGTAEAAKQASEDLRHTFLLDYRWSLFAVCTLVLAVGFGLGMLSDWWIGAHGRKPQPVITQAVQQAPQTHTSPASPVKSTHKKPAPPKTPAEAASPGSKE